MDIDNYSTYYSFHNIEEEYNTIKNKTIKEIFAYAYKKGLVDLVEYLYIWHGIEYEYDAMKTHDKIEGKCDDLMSIVYDNGASHGLKYECFSKNETNVLKSIRTLYKLRKYSKMKTKNKKYYFTFNTKYTLQYYNN